MEEDFIPNFIYRAQIGELANEHSTLSYYNDHLLISRNNSLEMWDVRTKEVVKRIGTYKKEKISCWCVADGLFVLGYDNGIVRAYNGDNTKMFGFRWGTRRITSLFYVHNLLFIGNAARTCSYDIMKNEVVMEYEQHAASKLPASNNTTCFVRYAGNTFYVYQYGAAHPVHVYDALDVISFCVVGDVLVFLDRNGEIALFDLRSKALMKNRLKIKKAHTVCNVNDELFVLTGKKVVYRYEIMDERVNNEKDRESDGKTIGERSGKSVDREDGRSVDGRSGKCIDGEDGRSADRSVDEKSVEEVKDEEVIDEKDLNDRETNSDREKDSPVNGRDNITHSKNDGTLNTALNKALSRTTNDKNKQNEIIEQSNDVVHEEPLTGVNGVLLKIRDLQPIGMKVRAITCVGRDIYGVDTNGKIIVMENAAHKMVFLCYHRNEILQVKLHGDVLFSVSVDKLIKWKITENERIEDGKEIVLVNSRDLQVNAVGMCLIGGSIVLADCEGISLYNMHTLELVETRAMENICAVSSCDHFVAIARNNELLVVDGSLRTRWCITDESEIVFVRFSGDEQLVGVSNYNNKINIYKLRTMELVMSLYGHSLPVRCFDFSNDGRSVISCSADKLVKLWGTEFGECRKTFYINSSMVMFMRHSKDLFLAADNDIHCYRKTESVKRYKNFDIKLFDYNNDYLVAAGRYSVYLYEMDKYELVKDSSSESEEELEIENLRVYDKFSKALEKSKEDADYDALFNAIKELDMGDIGSIISGLDNNSLYVVLQALKNNIDYNVVLAVKVFFSIVEHHRYFVTENQSAYIVYKEIRGRVESLRQLIKENDYKIGISNVMDG